MNKKFFNDDVNEEALKEQFIKYFGEEKWHEEEILTKFSGLTVNNIRYNNGTWNYEGTIYVQ